MSQAPIDPKRQNDEVLRFWARQASHQQAALEAVRAYLDSPKAGKEASE